MRADGIIRRFDDLGRIVIPRELRKQLFGTPETENMPIEIFIDGDNIILRKYEENKVDEREWKVKSNYYVTKCSHDTDVMYGLKQDFKFCPYCGKKIKVVEQMKMIKDRCIDCENTYNPNNDYCIRCQFQEAKSKFIEELMRTKVFKQMERFVDWLSNKLRNGE